MIMQKRKGKLTARLLIALMSVALVFTMMPLSRGIALAEEYSGEFVIKGNVLKSEMTVSEDVLRSLVKEDVRFSGVNNQGNLGATTVKKGVYFDSLIDFVGLKEGATIDHFVVVTNKIKDGSTTQQTTTIKKNWMMDAPNQDDLENGKGMLGFQWLDDPSVKDPNPVQQNGTKLFMGCFSDMSVATKGEYQGHIANKPNWIDTIVSIEVVGTVPEPKPEVKKGDTVKSAGSTYVVTNVAKKTVAFKKAKKAKKVTVPATVKIKGKTYKVTGISVKAFKGTKTKTVTIKTKKLTKKSVKGSLKGSKVKTIKVKVGKKSVNKKYVKKYKKFFTKKNAGKKVKVK